MATQGIVGNTNLWTQQTLHGRNCFRKKFTLYMLHPYSYSLRRTVLLRYSTIIKHCIKLQCHSNLEGQSLHFLMSERQRGRKTDRKRWTVWNKVHLMVPHHLRNRMSSVTTSRYFQDLKWDVLWEVRGGKVRETTRGGERWQRTVEREGERNWWVRERERDRKDGHGCFQIIHFNCICTHFHLFRLTEVSWETRERGKISTSI